MADKNEKRFNLDKSNSKFDLTKESVAPTTTERKTLWWLPIIVVILVLLGIWYFYDNGNQQNSKEKIIAKTEQGKGVEEKFDESFTSNEKKIEKQDQAISSTNDLVSDVNQNNVIAELDEPPVNNDNIAVNDISEPNKIDKSSDNKAGQKENLPYVKGEKYEIYYFPYNEYDYSGSNPELDKLISVMKADNSIRIKVNAYTDNIGSVEYNKKLSLQRAESIYNYLILQGIASNRIKYSGMGISERYDNSNESGRSKNRRAEFALTN